ncbi:uncharacterized protein K452DRAFT_362231 [Aplosporella prunicola CBS 121167]|uniref:DUF7580 domain-containing protein n=1 Tax=Aplosporella prunicola CBS 121167 TaxID=1176127 RepID=A0A6A6B2C0_9PEZI|nr:uncharacterized protein K452DRAFT_362231 [Aplosporella prunicola CBS 121167]KAF2136881.1 hypothetical protein K452DRAFT_362231 [Aplosporella prunicola CBS 121167]
MAGIEVAGIILGSIPLAISALEHYAEGVSVIKSMKQWEYEFLDAEKLLLLNVTIFKQSCEELLRGLQLPDDQFRDLVEHHKGWDDGELIQRLRLHMGSRNYAVYEASVSYLDRRLARLRKKLLLRDDFTAPFVVNGVVDERSRKKFFKKSWLRIKGGFEAGRGEYKELLAEIGDVIEKIDRLTTGALNTSDDIRSKQAYRPATSKYWLAIRNHTQGLYKALYSIWAGNCTAPHPHRAKLRLEIPKAHEPERPLFGLSFLLGDRPVNGRCLSPEKWRDVKVLSLETEVLVPLPQTQSYPSQKDKRAVRFAPAIVIQPATLPIAAPTSNLCTCRNEISNLCTTLNGKTSVGAQNNYSGPCLGFLSDSKRHYHLYSATGHANELIPLQDVLYRKAGKDIATKQKCMLAFALAATVLQLCETPWLPEDWQLNELYLDDRAEEQQLYILKTFDPATTCQMHPSKRRMRSIIRNETLFALGVALLELAYGQPLSSFQTDDDLNADKKEDELTRCSIALRLVENVQKRELKRFARAVSKCITPDTDSGFDLRDDGFRNRFYQDVVLPLQEDYETLF